jgi:hypothetical protein
MEGKRLAWIFRKANDDTDVVVDGGYHFGCMDEVHMIDYRVGDELQYKLAPNFDYTRTPNNYVIISIDKSKDNYRLQNLQNQEYSNWSKNNLDFYFLFIQHTR